MKYLVQIDMARLEGIKRSLAALKASAGVKPAEQILDYLVVDVPPGLVPSISALEGVIAVTPERWLSIKQVLIPIDEKIAEFQRLFLSNPITGPASAFKFSLEADMGKERIPTSESRKMIGADVADAGAITGKGIKVAVLDTGTNYLGVQGPYSGGGSSVEGQPIPADSNGHGTHVATTVSGRPFQSIHGLLKGVGIDIDVAAFKCLGYLIGAGTNTAVLRSMMDAFNWGADVISMSLGSPYTEEPTEVLPECRAIKMLSDQGIIIVVANGNCLAGTTRVLTPPRNMQPNRRRGGFKEIRYIRKGDPIINYNPSTRRFEQDKVVKTYKRETRRAEQIFKIMTDDGCVVEATEDHLFLTNQGWQKASELSIGDHLLSYPETPQRFKVPVKKKGFTLLEYQTGAILSGQRTRKIEARFCKYCSREFKVRPSSTHKFCSIECANEWMKGKHFSLDTEFKKGNTHIPANIDEIAKIGARALKEWRKEHPDKALEASRQGAVGVRKKLNKPTSIERTLQELLNTLGINYETEYPIKIETAFTIADIAIPERKIAIYADGDYWHKLPNVIEKDNRLTLVLERNGWRVFRFSGAKIRENISEVKDALEPVLAAVDPIVISIEKLKHRKIVYDLQTEKNHTIVANGLIVHNSGPEPNTVGVPANSPYALSVGAVDIEGNLAPFSSRGPTAQGLIKPDCVAPGVNILSTSAGLIAAMQFMDGPPLLAAISGTSMSCPHVSGTVALALQYARMKGKKLTTEGIKEALELYGEPKNNDYGHGLIRYQLLRRYIDEKL